MFLTSPVERIHGFVYPMRCNQLRLANCCWTKGSPHHHRQAGLGLFSLDTVEHTGVWIFHFAIWRGIGSSQGRRTCKMTCQLVDRFDMFEWNFRSSTDTVWNIRCRRKQVLAPSQEHAVTRLLAFSFGPPVFIVSLRLQLFVLICMKNSMLRIFDAGIFENAVGWFWWHLDKFGSPLYPSVILDSAWRMPLLLQL